ncbi:hypothetical protein ACPA0F_18485 [Solibacillus silvestris]
MQKYSVTIKNNETGETQHFETDAFLGALKGNTPPTGGSDTTQFILGFPMVEKELVKLVAGSMNMVYRSVGQTKAEHLLYLANKVAKHGYKQSHNNNSN